MAYDVKFEPTNDYSWEIAAELALSPDGGGDLLSDETRAAIPAWAYARVGVNAAKQAKAAALAGLKSCNPSEVDVYRDAISAAGVYIRTFDSEVNLKEHSVRATENGTEPAS